MRAGCGAGVSSSVPRIANRAFSGARQRVPKLCRQRDGARYHGGFLNAARSRLMNATPRPWKARFVPKAH